MAVLVDDLVIYPEMMVARAARKHGQRWCHLVSDASLEELHDFARRIGLKRAWFRRDHYDLTPGMRTRAITMGAKAVSSKELVQRMAKGE